METMIEGQTAEGSNAGSTWAAPQPIDVMLDSHMSINASSQASSDEPDEDTATSDERQQRSNSVPRSDNSRSKRKSTDESSEPNTRRKKYQERNRKKQSDLNQIAQAGFSMAKAMTAESEEESASLTKLDQLELCEEEHEEIYLNYPK